MVPLIIIRIQKLVKNKLKKIFSNKRSIFSILIDEILTSKKVIKIRTVKICNTNLRFGDFKIFRSEKKPIKKIENKNILNIRKLLGIKINIEIIKYKPPEKGGVIFLLIKSLCLKIFFLSLRILNLLKIIFNPNIYKKIIKNFMLMSIKINYALVWQALNHF